MLAKRFWHCKNDQMTHSAPIAPVLILAAAVLAGLVLVAMFLAGGNTQKRIDALMTPGQSPSIDDVKRIAETGDKIAAIKLYRQIYGVGLKEAKDAVEKL